MKIWRLPVLVLTALACLQAPPARANPPPDRAALLEIARQFVSKVGKGLEDADGYLSGLSPEDVRMRPYYEAIPDGEPLILQIMLMDQEGRAHSRIQMHEPVIGIKQGYDIFISLADFSYAAEFPIFVDGEKGTAEGWFIREEQAFKLDMEKKTVTAGKNAYTFDEKDVIVDNGDILVSSRVLPKWFGFEMRADPQTQRLMAYAEQPWPIQEKLARDKRRSGTRENYQHKNPVIDQPYAPIASVPTLDVNLRQRLRKYEGQKSDTSTSYTAQANGELLAHSARALMTGSDETMFRTLSVTLSRQSEKADLLGPMKARYYELNDVRTVSVPLAGSAPRERGVHVTNKDPYVTYDTSTRIEGEGPSGWEVELYRNDQYVSGTIVGLDGRYAFEDVTLFFGRNVFRTVLYGPQGETREEEQVFSVSPSTFGGGGLYEVSLSQQGTQTYTSTPSEDTDTNTPHFAATYERQVNDILALRGGVRTRQEAGDNATYAHGGTVSVFNNTIVNTDMTVKSTGSGVGSITARRNFGRHNLSLGTQYLSEDYVTNARTPGETRPAEWAASMAASGPLGGEKSRTSYDLNATTSRNSLGATGETLGLNLTQQVGRIVVANSLTYKASTSGGSPSSSTEETRGALSVRGNLHGVFWRAGAGYDVAPAARITDYGLQLSRNFSQQVSSALNLRHEPELAYTAGDASLSWHGEKFTLSPTVSYDSDRTVGVLMNARFGLARNPYTKDVVMSSEVLQRKGGVSAFVFLDKDGDNEFSEGDEPLPDVFVEAVQAYRHAFTDANGEAFIYDLSESRITDIVVQDSSAFDINWVPATEGIALRPRPGNITRVTFPIHRGGEIDGTAWLTRQDGEPRALRGLYLNLYNMDGHLEKVAVTASDGYYLFEKVRPGDYYLIVDQDDAIRNRVVRPKPQKITIGYEGTMLVGNDLFLPHGGGDIRLSVAPDLSDWLESNPGINTGLIEGQPALINLGNYNSRLLAMLIWYKLEVFEGGLPPGAELLLEPYSGNRSTRSGKFALRARLPEGSMEEAYDYCKKLAARGFYCEVEFLPRAGGREAAAGALPRG